MARPKEFDREVALEKAMEVFWTQGFEATSMSDLQRALGIGRQSLYDTFGDKRTVFDETLRHYIARSNARNDRLLAVDDGFEAVRNYFDVSIGEFGGQEPRRACMMFSTGVEVAPHDPEIAKVVNEGVKALQDALARSLERAKAQRSIDADADVQSLAMFLTSQMGGLVVMARAGATQVDMRTVADVALTALQPPPSVASV